MHKKLYSWNDFLRLLDHCLHDNACMTSSKLSSELNCHVALSPKVLSALWSKQVCFIIQTAATLQQKASFGCCLSRYQIKSTYVRCHANISVKTQTFLLTLTFLFTLTCYVKLRAQNNIDNNLVDIPK